MSTNILDPSAILSLLPTLLPQSAKSLASPQDGLAALLHAAFTALAFRLIAIDESSPFPSLSSNVLPDGWNKSGPGHYTFKYRHDQSSLEFVVKLSKLGGRTMINAIAVESERIASFDISTDDFVSPSFYPHDLDASGTSPLVHGFISSNRVSDLMSQFKLKIVQKLVPGLQKDGYIEEKDTSASSSSANPPPRGPTDPQPRPQAPPNAPDRNIYQPPAVFPRNPLEIGRSDLDPFPSNPFAPPSLFPQGGDGMFAGPDHPIFGMGRGNDQPLRGRWGGDGFLPPMGAPPGARFDPIGPMFGPTGGLGRGRGPRRPDGQNPDNDEFMPPGMGDMFM